MILDNIDFGKKYDFTLVLTKKSKKPIGILDGLTDRNLERSLDGIDKLSFTIPYYTTDTFTNERIKNPNYDKVIEENMILLKCGDASEPIYQAYFTIKNITESSDKMSKQVDCSSRETSLNKNTITLNGVERQLKKDEVNISDGIFDVLSQETSWSLGYLDENAKVEHINGGTSNKYRWFDQISKPWLQFLNEDVASAFNVILMYDTLNKKINVYDRDNYGKHTGIILSEENYIKNLNKKRSSESIVTNLEVTGRDGLDFSEVNPFGTSSIFNYDYFKMNGQMSDELISALDKYDILVNAKNIEFQALRCQIDTLNADKVTKQSEMTALNEELVALRHIQSGYMSSSDNTNLPQATTNVNNKVIQIANKQSEITSIQNQINSISLQTAAISNAIDKRNARDTQDNLIFNADLLEELEDFTYTENWENNYYKDPTLLLNGAKDVLKDWSVPTIEFDMDLIDFFGYVKAQKYWDKINLGDMVRVFSSKFNTNVDIRIVGYSYNIDSNDLKITFSNKNKKLNDARGISSVTKKSYEASKIVNTKKLEWNNIKSVKNAVDIYLNNALDLARQTIISQVGKNKINIDENGIFCINADDENQQIAILSSVIGFTSDGWQTANTCIDSTGVYAKFLVGKIILGEQLFIGNEDGTVELTGLGMTIKDESGDLKVKIGKLDNGNYGISIYNANGQIVLDQSGIIQTLTYCREDNVDDTHKLLFLVKIPNNTISTRNATLAFKLLPFRAYEKSVITASNSSQTAESGGAISTTSGSNTVNADGTTTIVYGNASDNFQRNTTTEFTNGDGTHYHRYVCDDIGFTLPNHRHTFSVAAHTHTISGHSHTSTLTYGIFESTTALGVDIYIDGVLRINGNYNTDMDNIDIGQWLTTSGYHSVELSTTRLGRINCSIDIQAFVSS